MDYCEEDDGAFGNTPEFGAIFMSNKYSYQESKRQLFGVYQASSDGALDILPNAFNHSGRHFPAQVRFRQIWQCDPLSEKEFRDAIIENYFSAKQFNFGLSKDQVRRLLYLFSSKKMKNNIPIDPQPEGIVEVAVKDTRWDVRDRHKLNKRGHMPTYEYDEIDTVALSDRHVSPFGRGKKDVVLVDDRANAEGKGYPFPLDDFPAKKRRIGEEGRLTTNSPKNSLDEVRRLTDSDRLLAAHIVNEDQVDKIHNHFLPSKHFLDQLDVGARDDYAVIQRSTLPDDYNMDDDYQQALVRGHYGDSVGQGKHVISDRRFLLDDCLEKNCNIDVVKPVTNSSADSLNLFRQTGDRVEDHELLINRKLENRHNGSSISAFNPSTSCLQGIRSTTAAGRFQIDEKTSLHGGSLGNFSPSSTRSQQYTLESEKLSRPQENALQFGNIDFARSTSGLHTSLPQEMTNSAVNTNFLMDMDLNTSAPVSYRGSLSSRLSPHYTDHENFEGEKGLVPYYSKSMHNHFSFHGNLPEASEHQSQHVSLHGRAMLTGKESVYSESKDLGMGISQPEKDLAIYEKQHFGFSSYMNIKKLHKTSEANSVANRRSVFTRLSSKASSPSCGYVDARADEVMEMLQQYDDLLSPRKLGNSGESAVNEKKTQCNMKTDNSTMEKKKLKNASQITADSVNEIPRETATLDFKHHSTVNGKKTVCNMDTGHSTMEKKGMTNTSQTTADSMDEIQKETRTVDFELHSSVNEKKTVCNMETGHSKMEKKKMTSTSQTTADGMDEIQKETRNLDFERHSAVNEKITQFNMETGHSIMEKKKMIIESQSTTDSMDEIQKETRMLDFKRRSDRKKKSVGIATDSASHNKLPGDREVKSSMSSTLRRKKLIRPVFSKIDIAIGSTCCNETSLIPALIPDKDDKQCCNLHESEIPNDIAGSSNVLASQTFLEIDYSRELSYPTEQNCGVAHVLPTTNVDLKRDEQANDHLHIVSSKDQRETFQQRSLDIQKFIEDVLAKDTYTTIKETYQQISGDIQTSVEGVLANDTDTTIKETSQRKSLNIQTSAEGKLAEDADAATKKTSIKDTYITIKETYLQISGNIQTSVEGVLAKDTDTTIKEISQQKSLDIQTSAEGKLAEDAEAATKETSQQKSLGPDTDTTIIGLSQPESSLEEFKFGAGFKEKH